MGALVTNSKRKAWRVANVLKAIDMGISILEYGHATDEKLEELVNGGKVKDSVKTKVLICEKCGEPHEVEIKRGRPPSICKKCKEEKKQSPKASSQTADKRQESKEPKPTRQSVSPPAGTCLPELNLKLGQKVRISITIELVGEEE